ncbi:MAG: diguanylate cyclase, partial [Pseudomonadales bacterium]|nr:diguanylate cyclase [Pseudomonadales bacterium]
MTLLLPAGIIPLIVFALFAFFYIQGNTQRYTINTLQASIEDVSARIEKHMSIANTSLELLANEQSLTSLLRDNPRPDNQQLSTIKRALDNFQRNNPAFISISLLSDNGIILQSTTTSVPPEMYLMNIDDRSFEDSLTLSDFQKQRQEGGLLYMQTRKLKHYPAGQPFDSSEGYLQLIYQINGEEILADAANTTDTGYLALTDSDGNVFFHTAPDGKLASELATKAVQGRHRTIKTYQMNGQGYFAGFNRLHQGLYLIGFTSETAASQQARTLATYSFWLLLVIILISIGVVHLQSRMMFIDRIISLAELTRRIRDGKPIQDIDISGKDELSDLSKAFQEMAESLKKSQQEINKLAYYDHLTELPNKLTFDAALNKAIEYSERSGRALAILVVDLDNFKLANDVYGHSAGDDILRQVAHRLKTCLGHVNTSEVTRSSQGYYAEDMIIRNGGDEFSILLTDLFQAYQASLIAQRIIDELSLPFKAGDSNVKLGASIGISIYPVDGVSSEQLIKNADLAMFEAKKNGKNNFQFFTQALNSSAAKRLNTEEELNQAIALDEFVVHYPPMIYMPTGRIKVLEA